ncbi:MAG: leishmanolysin-related zinc metalloendopeptidase [Cyanobacteriota bacterium]|nr:leishmanolysin-related zinc metalloendopeptidase [Cyanobacteriota bacterium]
MIEAEAIPEISQGVQPEWGMGMEWGWGSGGKGWWAGIPILWGILLLLVVLAGCGSWEKSRVVTVVDPQPDAGVGERGFDIEVRFGDDSFTLAQQAAFERAASRWMTIMTSDLSNIALSLPSHACLQGLPAVNQAVDDLLIDVLGVVIDGRAGVLGAASPCVLRRSNQLPVYGFIQFDIEDVVLLEERGQLETVIVHEMGHVLGFGTLWPRLGLAVGVGGEDPRFAGAQANLQYGALGGMGSVPIEDQGGSGTADVHWRESVFDTELMTGSLNGGLTNPLSRLTLGSLLDMGYQVNFAQADPYQLPETGARRRAGMPLQEQLLPVVMQWVD